MTSGGTGSVALDLLFSWIMLAFVFYLILRNWRSIAAGIVALGIVGVRAWSRVRGARCSGRAWRGRIRGAQDQAMRDGL